jgi:hypothetical protein
MVTFPIFVFSASWVAGMVGIVAIAALFFDDASPLFTLIVFEYLMAFLGLAVVVSSLESLCRNVVNGFVALKMKELSAFAYLKEQELNKNVFLKIESRSANGDTMVLKKTEESQGDQSQGDQLKSSAEEVAPPTISPQSETDTMINTPPFSDDTTQKINETVDKSVSFGEDEIPKKIDSDAQSGASTVGYGSCDFAIA